MQLIDDLENLSGAQLLWIAAYLRSCELTDAGRKRLAAIEQELSGRTIPTLLAAVPGVEALSWGDSPRSPAAQIDLPMRVLATMRRTDEHVPLIADRDPQQRARARLLLLEWAATQCATAERWVRELYPA